MSTYYAEIQYTTTLIVRLEMTDGISPTSEDVYEAASYMTNHLDEYITDKRINHIEEDNLDA
jgi:hypothetical protein